MKTMIRFLSCLLVVIMLLTAFTACTQKKEETANKDASTATQDQTSSEDAKYEGHQWDNPRFTDSSELPAWTGKKMSVKMWWAQGQADKSRVSSNDVVWPEIERITGVNIDKENTFDNGQDDFSVKLTKIVASGDYPTIVYNPQGEKYLELIKAGAVYDLSPYIEKYCPNIQRTFSGEFGKFWTKTFVSPNGDGKIYQLPIGFYTGNTTQFQAMFPDYPKDKLFDAGFPNPAVHPNMLVRDDMLKKVFPNAKTQDELEAVFTANKKFTREDIFDVPIKSKEDWIKFMYALRDLNIKEGNKTVYPMYVRSGGDNWPLLATTVAGVWGVPDWRWNYFTYWDKVAKKVVFGFQQDYFKDMLNTFDRFVRDGVASKESLVDNDAAFSAKLNNGLYATAYAWHKPDEAALKAAGKTFRYRKVYFDIQNNTDRFAFQSGDIVGGLMGISIFKSAVKEEDLPQLLRSYDLLFSQIGEKLVYWGPKSAGLFEETNGLRKFKDKDLEDAMVYNKDNGKNIEYNLTRLYCGGNSGWQAQAWPYVFTKGLSEWAPVVYYAKNGMIQVDPANALKYNDSSLFNTYTAVPGTQADLWNFNGAIPSVDEFWKARNGWEDKLTKCLTAKDDSEFEKFYKDVIDYGSKIGLNDKMLEEINKYYAENTNKEYMDYLLK